MAKTVFGSHIQTAHVWAQGRGGDCGHGDSSDKRMFFRGRALYSYGTHFALGYVILGADGKPETTLINADSYSPSTGKHQSHTRSAARGRTMAIADLTSLVGALDYLTLDHGQQPRPAKVVKELQAGYRAQFERHITKYFNRTSEDTAAFLLALVGGTAKQAEALLVKARKAHAKQVAAEAKATFDSELKDARDFAAMNSNAFRSHARAVIGDYEYQAERNRLTLAKKLHKAHRAASKADLKTIKAKVWQHILATRAMESSAARGARVAGKRKDARHSLKIIRQYMANEALNNNKRPLGQAAWAVVAQSAHVLARFLDRRPSLNNLATELMALHEQARENEQAALRAANAERVALEESKRLEWLDGAHNHFSGRTAANGAYLRALDVERDEAGAVVAGTLQTSQGAEVPLVHALRAFKFIKLCRDNGQPWQANGRTVPVGHFRIERIDANGDFKAGCHFIEWEQVADLAARLDVADWQGDESAVVTSEHA